MYKRVNLSKFVINVAFPSLQSDPIDTSRTSPGTKVNLLIIIIIIRFYRNSVAYQDNYPFINMISFIIYIYIYILYE